ncbi:MAG: RidA family protein [Treponema sp.]|nr:RidA family protein [Treponema sp.]
MIKFEEALKKHKLEMPNPPVKGGIYNPAKSFGGNLCYLSGCVPAFNGEIKYKGKLGAEVTIEQGQEAAKQCALNLLANIIAAYGSLEKVKCLVKMIVFVAGTESFYDHPKVANGASELLVDILGEDIGLCARSAVGVNALPGNVPVEIELLLELKP